MGNAEDKPFDPTLPPPLNTMTLEEMDAFSDSFDREDCDEDWQPLTPEMRAISERAARKLPDPPAMKEVKTIRVSLRPDLVRRTQAEADRRGTSRDAVIADVLEKALSA